MSGIKFRNWFFSAKERLHTFEIPNQRIKNDNFINVGECANDRYIKGQRQTCNTCSKRKGNERKAKKRSSSPAVNDEHQQTTILKGLPLPTASSTTGEVDATPVIVPPRDSFDGDPSVYYEFCRSIAPLLTCCSSCPAVDVSWTDVSRKQWAGRITSNITMVVKIEFHAVLAHN